MNTPVFTPKWLLILIITCLFSINNACAQTITTYAGVIGDNQLATIYGRLLQPAGVAVDGSGNIYIVDQIHRIRKVSPAGIITTIAGNAMGGFSIGGAAIYAQIGSLRSVT